MGAIDSSQSESNSPPVGRLDTLVFENKRAAAANLIGKTVGGLADHGSRVSGTVTAVLRQRDDVILQLDTGWRLTMDDIELIHEPAPQPAPTG